MSDLASLEMLAADLLAKIPVGVLSAEMPAALYGMAFSANGR